MKEQQNKGSHSLEKMKNIQKYLDIEFITKFLLLHNKETVYLL